MTDELIQGFTLAEIQAIIGNQVIQIVRLQTNLENIMAIANKLTQENEILKSQLEDKDK